MNDAQLIDRLGGPARLAEELGFNKSKGGVQRVCNWKTRGIPAKVKLRRPDLFLLYTATDAHEEPPVPKRAEEVRDAA